MDRKEILKGFFYRGLALLQEGERIRALWKEEKEKVRKESKRMEEEADRLWDGMTEEQAQAAQWSGRKTSADRALAKSDKLDDEAETLEGQEAALSDFLEEFRGALKAVAKELKVRKTPEIDPALAWLQLPSCPRDAKLLKIEVKQRIYEPDVKSYILLMRLILDTHPLGSMVEMSWDVKAGQWVKSYKVGGKGWPWLGSKLHGWLGSAEGQAVLASLYQGERENFVLEVATLGKSQK